MCLHYKKPTPQEGFSFYFTPNTKTQQKSEIAVSNEDFLA